MQESCPYDEKDEEEEESTSDEEVALSESSAAAPRRLRFVSCCCRWGISSWFRGREQLEAIHASACYAICGAMPSLSGLV